MSQSLKVNAVGIGVFAAITALLIATTYVLTKAPIKENVRQQQSKKLYEIIGDTQFDNDVFEQVIELPGKAFGFDKPIKAQVAMLQDKVQTVIFPVLTPKGYSGNITLLVGINADTSIAGVRVITHRETPGLGDKVELKKSNWILSFNQQSKQTRPKWAVKKDGGQFDQFTGATITPRAVVNAVGNALDYFIEHQQQLLATKRSATLKEVDTNGN
jgi:electron transport complex protein RnfG